MMNKVKLLAHSNVVLLVYQWVLDGLWHWNLGMISDCLLDLGYLTVWVVWTLYVWFDICLLLYVCFVIVSFVVTRI